MKEEEYRKYLSRASRLCAGKEKCKQDILKKVAQWGLDTDTGERIIDDLKKANFIDHQRYAEAFARDKLRFNHWGRRKIEYALRSKNIEDIHIQHALDNLPEEQYHSILLDELEKKHQSIKTNDLQERKSKLCQFLLQKGFESGKVFEFVDYRLRQIDN